MSSKMENIFSIFEKENPEPKSELNYVNDYTFLVAVMLSAQSTDKGVNKATEALFKVADAPDKMLNLGEEKLKEYIKTIGFYNNKAANVIKASQMLMDLHNGQVPNDQKALVALPGVGSKTAYVVRNELFDEEVIAVDTHVLRVSNRTGIAHGDKPVELEKELNKIIPVQFKKHAGDWLVLHGRYVCKARKPDCDNCKICEHCDYYQHNHIL